MFANNSYQPMKGNQVRNRCLRILLIPIVFLVFYFVIHHFLSNVKLLVECKPSNTCN